MIDPDGGDGNTQVSRYVAARPPRPLALAIGFSREIALDELMNQAGNKGLIRQALCRGNALDASYKYA